MAVNEIEGFTPDRPEIEGFTPDTQEVGAIEGFTPDSPSPDIYRELEERSFFDRPLIVPEVIKADEFRQIADRHKVDPAALRSVVGFMGGIPESSDLKFSDVAGKILGFVDQAALGIGSKLYKKLQDPALERALDDLQYLAEGRKPYIEKAAEIATPVGIGGAKGAVTGGRALAKSVGIGAVAGAAGARAGEEIPGALLGGTIGAATQGIIGKLSKKSPEVAREASNTFSELGESLEQSVSSQLEKRRDADSTIMSMIRSGSGTTKTASEVEDILSIDIGRARVGTSMGDLLEESAEAADAKRANIIYKAHLTEFADFLTRGGKETPRISISKEPLKSIREFGRNRGMDEVERMYNLFVTEREVSKFVRGSNLVNDIPKTQTREWINKVMDAQYVLKSVSEGTGVEADLHHLDLNKQINLMSYSAGNVNKYLSSMYHSIRKSGDISLMGEVTGKGTKIYDALDTGDFSKLNAGESEIAGRFRNYFEEVRKYVNGEKSELGELPTRLGIKPMTLQRIEGGAEGTYVTHVVRDIDELEKSMYRQVGELLKFSEKPELGVAGIHEGVFSQINKVIRDVDSGKMAEDEILEGVRGAYDFLKGMTQLNGGKRIGSGKQLAETMTSLFSTSRGATRINVVARSAMERGEKMPMWMRETDLFKIADKYGNGLIKYVHLRDPMSKLASDSRVLRKIGYTQEADYIETLLQDVVGGRDKTLASDIRQMSANFSRYVDRKLGGGKLPPKVTEAIKFIPDALGSMHKLVYPNILGGIGGSPRAILLQATQPLLKTAPELGGTYGYSKLVKSALKVALAPSNYWEKIKSEGMIPKEFISQSKSYMRRGIEDSVPVKVTSATIDAMSDVGMFMYTAMDKINRAISTSMADEVAADFIRGDKGAIRAVSKMPASIRRRIAGAAGDELEVSRIIGDHLNSATQYNYNRASMSEFGRTMGGIFSTFSKWPTATIGDIVADYRTKGKGEATKRTLEKYIYPLMLMAGATGLINKVTTGDATEFSDRTKLLTGQYGLVGSAPITSIPQVISGDIFSPPVVDVGFKTVGRVASRLMQGIRDEDLLDRPGEDFVKIVSDPVRYFMPGSGFIRFFMEDMVTLRTGERPGSKGQSWIERMAEGAESY